MHTHTHTHKHARTHARSHTQGPVEIVLGLVAGLIGGLFCSLTQLWDTRPKRVIACCATSAALLFTFYHYGAYGVFCW